MKIYGPYLRRDGRKHLVIIHSDGRRQTKSWPRHLLEQHLGRELLPTEHVDHIDNDSSNNAIENLQLLSLADNARKEMHREHRKEKLYEAICPVCKITFTIPYRRYKRNQLVLEKDGPFCSKSCVGKKYN